MYPAPATTCVHEDVPTCTGDDLGVTVLEPSSPCELPPQVHNNGP